MRVPIVASALCLLATLVFAQVPDRSTAVSSEIVSDEFIGYLFSLLVNDHQARISGDRLRELFPEYDGATTPIDFIVLLERTRGDPGSIRLVFEHEVAHPAPLDILGHKPVMLYSTMSLGLREVHYEPSARSAHEIESAYALYVEDGEFAVDFAGWLDFLLGSIVDDVDVSVVLAIRYEERWYGAVAGYNPDRRTVTGVYDMQRGRFLVRPPEAITSFALERLAD